MTKTMMNNIERQLIEFFPLQKVEVVESKKSVYKPGSIGYVVHTGSAPGFVIPIGIMFMRYGIKGKYRVAFNTLYNYLIKSDNLDKKTAKLLNYDNCAQYNYYGATAEITPAIQETKNLIDMPGYEFVCYVAAFSMYLSYVSNLNSNVGKPAFIQFKPYKMRRADILRFMGQIELIGPIELHSFITGASSIGKVDKHDLLKEIVAFYDIVDNRKKCMEKIYKSSARYKRSIEQYHINRISIQMNTMELIGKILSKATKGKK